MIEGGRQELSSEKYVQTEKGVIKKTNSLLNQTGKYSSLC